MEEGLMKKVGELMKELGFKPGANEEVTKAFVKNLIRQAYGVEVKEAAAKELTRELTANSPAKPEQLSFNIDTPITPRKKLA
jgi:hypothetical protein